MTDRALVTVEAVSLELGRSFVSMREFGGMTVEDALSILKQEFPDLKPPYQINGFDLDETNRKKMLREGDVLTVDP